jgi:uncharacterized coiled-coil protein SlyX
MKKNLKNLFTEDVQAILTDETLTAIEEAFNAKVESAVEAALLEQDELYATKLQTFYTAIDKDHSKKMKRVVESVDKSNASKLVKIVKLYERDHSMDATKFKKSLVESISEYLEEYLVETVGAKDLAQAVKNKTAYNVLENMRKVLSIDSVMMKESVQEAVIDGKNQITELQKENAELKKQFKALYEQNKKTEVTSLLEAKVSKFPEAKKNFIKKALEDKSLEFINENFDYAVRLFDKQEKTKLTTLKEEALKKRVVKPDVVPFQKTEKVIEEKVNKDMGGYLHALSKGKGLK